MCDFFLYDKQAVDPSTPLPSPLEASEVIVIDEWEAYV